VILFDFLVFLSLGLENSIEDGSTDSSSTKNKSSLPSYAVKYYKGLGTSTASEGREYFDALTFNRKVFGALCAKDGDSIDLVFNRLRVGDRRDWLLHSSANTNDEDSYLRVKDETVSYQNFINKEFIQFSYADLMRSIPNVVDGLKPSQRKVLYGCLKKNLVKSEAKVVQIAGYIAEQTAYHHGEDSLHRTIINMAQDFVGSNNVPLLVASGQFGTRAQGGKDYASPRYVFTRLSPVTRLLFPEEDDSLLEYLEEDGLSIEPRCYIPIVPTLLLNGAEGIGTGWSTSIPPFRLLDVIESVRHKVKGTAAEDYLRPYISGFTGVIEPEEGDDSRQKYRSIGVMSKTGNTSLHIKELPYGVWTENYKDFLCDLVQRGVIKDFKEFHTTDKVHFEVNIMKAQMVEFERLDNFATAFRMSSGISLTNMHAFDTHGKIRKYNTPEEIVDDHYEVRLQAYVTRKESLERKLAAEELRARNRSRFLSSILSGEVSILSPRQATSPGAAGGVSAVSAIEIVDTLQELGFADEWQIDSVANPSNVHEGKGEDIGSAPISRTRKDFAYLLDLPIHSLTEEKSLQLHRRAQEAAERLASIRSKTVQDLWLADLEKLTELAVELEKKKRKV
jgi:DNA topoisomerase II